MFKKFLKSLAEIFNYAKVYDNLEAHIVSGNPQNSGDVERLEREYMDRQRPMIDRYY